MIQPIDYALIRIFHPNGFAVGAGFLIDDYHTITCAHVVASAIGLKTYPDNIPSYEISFDFPLVAPGQKLTARLLSWQAPATGQGDVAVLEITSNLPKNAFPARLIQSANLWHHTFRAFGFPKHHENGTWAIGRILGTKAGGWQQIESTEQTGYFVQPGFSGGPVWDERLGGVVGMIMEAETATRAAFISPMGVLAATYPPLAEKIEQIISAASDAPAPGEPPFKGLLYFDVQDAPLFFGREALTQELTQRLLQDGSNFLAIVGASGSGKSSLVRAGLIPVSMAVSPGWICRIITPTAHPLKELAATLTADVESTSATTTLIDDLTADPRSLDIATFRFLKRQNAPHLLLVVDQFEELFTACKDLTERKAFIDNLLYAAGIRQTLDVSETSKVSIVLTLRADFYHHCAQYDNLRAALETHQAYIGPMTANELRRAVEAPARQNKWNFELGLVDVMLRDVNEEPGALPLLSHALLETWHRRKGRTLTLAGYYAAGGVRGAIAQTADRVYADLPADSKQIARDIFLHLTELGEGTQDTRRRALLNELIPDPTHRAEIEIVLKTLTDARLVTIEKDTAEVTHEALIREWPALREWLDKNREGLRLHRQLTEAAIEWDKMERDVNELYRGSRLANTLILLDTENLTLSLLEREFLEASRQEEDRLILEEEFARRMELEQAQKLANEQHIRANTEQKSARLVRRFAIGLAVLLVLAVIALAFAFWQVRVAQAQNLLIQAQIEQEINNYQRAVLFSLESFRLYQTPETTSLLSRLPYFESPFNQTWEGQTDTIWSVAWSPDGNHLASGTTNGRIIIWEAATGKQLQILEGHKSNIWSIMWSPDGNRLASGSADMTIMVWEAATGEHLQTIKGHTGSVNSVAWSPDGNRLASGSADMTIMVWEASTGEHIQTLKGHTGSVDSVAWSPDGNHLASGSADDTIIIWEKATGNQVQTLLVLTDLALSVAWSPDGNRLASGSADGNVLVWEMTTGKQVQTLVSHTGFALSVAWSPDGNRLASGSSDGNILVWEMTTGKQAQTLVGHTAPIWSIAWSPDGSRLASGSVDKTISLWEVTSGEHLQTLEGHEGNVWTVAWSPDGSRLASSSTAENRILVWEAATGERLQTLEGQTDTVWSVAWSPDGDRLASGTTDGRIIIWEAATGEQLQTLEGHTGVALSVAWSPDGNRLAAGSEDETIIVWEGTTGELLQTLNGHSDWVGSVVWSPNGNRLASGSLDGRIIIWETATGEQLQTLEGYSGKVLSVSWSPDGDRIASGTTDGRIIIWEVATGEQLQTLEGHTDWVRSVAWSPSGNHLASGSEDRTVRLIPAQFTNPPCEWVGRNLTESEWLTYRGISFVYRPTCPNLPSPEIQNFLITPRGRVLILFGSLASLGAIGIIGSVGYKLLRCCFFGQRKRK